MGKYFGTDGFRGEANVKLTVEHAFKVGRYLGWYYGRDHKARIVIGKDTRRSSYMFEYALAAGITASGADAYLLHVTTTPSVSYVVRTEGFDCGIMISASHNPFYDNGIKVINGLGHKLEAEVEEKIEAYIDGATEERPLATGADIGRTVDFAAGRNRYIGYLISLPTRSFKNMRVGLDCANGSASAIAKSVFDALGAKTYVINNEPDGTNINTNCGSTHIEVLQKFVKEKQLDVGFAYDGDADRCIAVDENGEVQFYASQDNYKAYLQTLNQWYNEGLIDRDLATLNGDQVTSKMTTDKAGASVGWAASRMQVMITTAQTSNPDYSLVPTPTPTLNAGETPVYGFMENQFPDVGAAITTSCENVELAARFLDYGYSEEGHDMFNFGIEGVSYNWDGDHAVYTEEVTNNPDGWPLAQALGKYIRANYNGPFVQDINYLEEYLQVDTVKECPTVWAVDTAAEHTMPNVTPTQEESDELATIQNELNTYVDEMTLKFIFGTESFDNWDSYIQTLNDLGLERALEIERGALERYNAR